MRIEPTGSSETQPTETMPSTVNEVVATKKMYKRPVLNRHGNFESTTHLSGDPKTVKYQGEDSAVLLGLPSTLLGTQVVSNSGSDCVRQAGDDENGSWGSGVDAYSAPDPQDPCVKSCTVMRSNEGEGPSGYAWACEHD